MKVEDERHRRCRSRVVLISDQISLIRHMPHTPEMIATDDGKLIFGKLDRHVCL